jgi:hypothetical protein
VNEHFWFPNGSDDFLKRNTINFLNYALTLRRSAFLVFTMGDVNKNKQMLPCICYLALAFALK